MKRTVTYYIVGLFFACFILPFGALSQIDAQFSQYMFLNSYVNPGATGIKDVTEASLIYRSQWTGLKTSDATGLSGTPVTQILSASTAIRSMNSGIGGYIVNDALGPLRNINAKLNYAYHIKIGNGKLGFGVALGVFSQSIEYHSLVSASGNANDPTITALSSRGSALVFDVGGGIFYNTDKYYFGASISHINKPAMYNDTSTLARTYYLTGGYNIALSELFTLTPSVLVKSNLNPFNTTSIDLSAIMKYDNGQFWGGATFRSGDALVILLGVGLLKDHALKVGYSFDLTVIGSAAKAGTSHEIMVTYSKPVRDLLPKPIIRTPRYRF